MYSRTSEIQSVSKLFCLHVDQKFLRAYDMKERYIRNHKGGRMFQTPSATSCAPAPQLSAASRSSCRGLPGDLPDQCALPAYGIKSSTWSSEGQDNRNSVEVQFIEGPASEYHICWSHARRKLQLPRFSFRRLVLPSGVYYGSTENHKLPSHFLCSSPWRNL